MTEPVLDAIVHTFVSFLVPSALSSPLIFTSPMARNSTPPFAEIFGVS